MILERDRPWQEARLPMLDARVRRRLDGFSAWLGGADWPDGAFSAGELLMAPVLRRLGPSGRCACVRKPRQCAAFAGEPR
jgi:glutathione S-transferase